jgi:hypothetical protein
MALRYVPRIASMMSTSSRLISISKSVNISVPASSDSAASSTSHMIGPILGGVLGSLACITAIAGFLWILRRRRQRSHNRMDIALDEPADHEREVAFKDYSAAPAPYPYPSASSSSLIHHGTSTESIDSTTPALQPAGAGGPSNDWDRHGVPGDVAHTRSLLGDDDPCTIDSIGLSYSWPPGEPQIQADGQPAYGRVSSGSAPSAKLIAEMRRMRESIPLPSESAASSSSAPLPSPDSLGPTLTLRAEVENLRREMEVIRMERVEPPPRYND